MGDQNGAIDEKEYKTFAASTGDSSEQGKRNQKMMFKQMDTDGNGKISRKEADVLFQKLAPMLKDPNFLANGLKAAGGLKTHAEALKNVKGQSSQSSSDDDEGEGD